MSFWFDASDEDGLFDIFILGVPEKQDETTFRLSPESQIELYIDEFALYWELKDPEEALKKCLAVYEILRSAYDNIIPSADLNRNINEIIERHLPKGTKLRTRVFEKNYVVSKRISNSPNFLSASMDLSQFPQSRFFGSI